MQAAAPEAEPVLVEQVEQAKAPVVAAYLPAAHAVQTAEPEAAA